MDYRPNVRERKYTEMPNQEAYLTQMSSMMYERAVRMSLLPGSHIGDYSKELLEEPSKRYENKMPKQTMNNSSNYQFLNKFSIN